MPTDVVRVRVPAKLNLHLGVGAARADGYHELVTVFHAVEVYDTVTVRRAGRLAVSGGGPAGSGNIAWRAAALLAQHAGVAPDASIEIDKAIPMAGGMAGGSADAAATLLGCARLWGLALDDTTLIDLAARLGSDVPFCLFGGTALATGRGERLAPVDVGAALTWVFARAPFGISTAACYAELDRLRAAGEAPAPIGPPEQLLGALGSGDVAAIGAALGNDLQAAALALRPGLAETLRRGLAAGAAGAVVSGSGPTCAFLAADAAAASELAAALHASGACAATQVAHGPSRPFVGAD